MDSGQIRILVQIKGLEKSDRIAFSVMPHNNVAKVVWYILVQLRSLTT
jgi:hypothetical protein